MLVHLLLTSLNIATACRFYSEEAYSFRVRQVLPEALRVLDMQDMHCLRKGVDASKAHCSSLHL